MESTLIQTARARAGQILLANGGELGLLGSQQAYQPVWARDSMICGLAMYLFAAEAVERNRVFVFDQEHGWSL